MSFLSYAGFLFKTWIETLFIVPFRNYDMLWLLVPVWVAWFFAEFYQEKAGTSLGNAITNAVVVLWGSIDCTRQTVNLILTKVITAPMEIFLRFSLITIVFAYGLIIVILGIKANKLVKYIGRVRVVTYVFAMFVPIFYNAIPFSWNHLIATIVFFPLFYYAIEILDRIIPDPKAVVEDSRNKEQHHMQHAPMHHPETHEKYPYQHNQYDHSSYLHQNSRR